MRVLRTQGLVERCTTLSVGAEEGEEGTDDAQARDLAASLEAVHNPFYLTRFAPKRMKRLAAAGQGSGALAEEAAQWDSVYLSVGSGRAARRAAAASLKIADALVRAEVANGMAVVRPPGHHAEPCAAKGFCLVNNVAVVGKKLVDQGERVLIVDWVRAELSPPPSPYQNPPRTEDV